VKPADRQEISAVVPLLPSDVDELRQHVLGPVLLPQDDGYDEERCGFELSVDHRPAVIVCATGAADVIAAVGFAAERKLPVGVQATGHGASTPVTGVFINTRRMTGVHIDASAKSARIEAGVRWDKVIHEAAVHTLAPLSGSAPFVGAVSYTLGGGLGLLSRQYGHAADHVLGFDLVTADGRLLQVSADQHPDLFWGVRGSKGNLGIVTSIKVRLFPVERLYGGGLFFDGESVREVLDTYFAWTATVPEQMSSSMFMVQYPDVDELPEPIRGRFVVHLRLAYLGDPAEGERLFKPLRESGPAIMDTVASLPYTQAGTIHSDPPSPVASYSKTLMVRQLNPDATEAIIKLAGPEANAVFGLEVRHLGGALARPADSPSAVGYFPNARFNVYVASLLEPGQQDAIDNAQQQMIDALKPWADERVCLNFLAGANQSVQRVRTAYTAENYARLQELKAQYDPHNTFRFNPNIPPAP
jgi:hypothetical protein